MNLPLFDPAILKQTIFSLYGGAEKLDLWITCTADRIAKVKEIPPEILTKYPSVPGLPGPSGIVDFILDNFGMAKIWEYKIENDDMAIRVIDPISKHIIEEAPFSEENLRTLAAKYGENGHGRVKD